MYNTNIQISIHNKKQGNNILCNLSPSCHDISEMVIEALFCSWYEQHLLEEFGD